VLCILLYYVATLVGGSVCARCGATCATIVSIGTIIRAGAILHD
jgi:hypothetical protein